MRLFIGIRFNELMIEELWRLEKCLQNAAISGTFIRKENFHLTLSFLGETESIDTVVQIMNRLEFPVFSLMLKGIGSFCSDQKGKTIWVGVEYSEQLQSLQRTLERSLLESGYSLEMRAFQPHITLGRKVLLREDSYLNELSRAVLQQKMQVERISLMRSEIQQGVRMYKEVYSKELSWMNQSIPCQSFETN